MLRALAFLLIATSASAQDAPAATSITVTTVREQVLRDRVIASGLIGPVETVQVQPLIEGQPIETLEADVGDTVAAGQVLARLSPASLELQRSQLAASKAQAAASVAQADAGLVEAEAARNEARRVAARTAQLRASNATSEAAADTATANLATAEARVTAAAQGAEAARAQVDVVDAQIADLELQLSRTEVKTPVAGEIVQRNAVVGAIASAQGNPMFTLIRDGALELRADVAEADLPRLRQGQTARLRTVAGEEITGTVRLVEPQVNETTRLGRIRIAVDDPAALRSGMFAEAEVLVAETPALSVPLTAVGRDADGAFVVEVRDGVAHRQSVTTGVADGPMIGVEGVAEGAQVVTRAGAFVRNGDRVNPVEAEG